jgi:hypothetical protein
VKLTVPSEKRRARFRKPPAIVAASQVSTWPLRAVLLAALGVVASAWALHRHLTMEKPIMTRPAPTEIPAPDLLP